MNNRGRGGGVGVGGGRGVGIKMSWVEKNRKVNNWGWGWTIIRDSRIQKQIQMPQFHNFKRKYQKHLCQLALIYVTNINQLFWKLTKEKFSLHEVNFGEAAKI